MSQDSPQNNPYSPSGVSGQNDQVVAEIKKQAMASLIWGIVGIFCCGIVLGPFAVYRGNKAKRLIAEHNVGQEFGGQATAGLICGWIGIVLFVVGVGLQVVLALAGAAAQ